MLHLLLFISLTDKLKITEKIKIPPRRIIRPVRRASAPRIEKIEYCKLKTDIREVDNVIHFAAKCNLLLSFECFFIAKSELVTEYAA